MNNKDMHNKVDALLGHLSIEKPSVHVAKKSHRRFYNFILLLAACLSIGFCLMMPVWSDKRGIDIIQDWINSNDGTLNPLGDPGDTGWWHDTNWGYCKKITINHNQVDATLINFPILVQISSDDNLANNTQSDGDDILFTGDTTGININETKYNHEIEHWNDDGNYVNASIWVNITSLSSSADTMIWMYYGNESCGSQENIAGTWDSNYVAIWHMNDITTSTIADSTSNSNDGAKESANNPIEITGIVGKAQDFDGGGTDSIDCGDDNSLDYTVAYTLEAWVKPDTAGATYGRVVDKYPAPTLLWREDLHQLRFYGIIGGISRDTSFDPSCRGIAHNKWSYIATAYDDATDDLDGFTNESNCNTIYSYSGALSTTTVNLFIGNRESTGRPFGGIIDEVRNSNIRRSNSWLSTTYNTIIDPSSFLSIGDEQSAKFNNQLGDYWFQGGNISSNNQLGNFWFLGNNVSNNNQLGDYWFQGGNISSNNQLGNFWFLGGNTTARINEQLDVFWFLGGNSSTILYITNENPVNKSSIQSEQPVLYFSLTNPNGLPINYSIFVGNSTQNATYLVDNISSVSNGTFFYSNYTNATEYGTNYYWRVYAEDGTNIANETFHFILSFGSAGYIVGGSSAGVIAFATVGLLLFVLGLMVTWKRRRKG